MTELRGARPDRDERDDPFVMGLASFLILTMTGLVVAGVRMLFPGPSWLALFGWTAAVTVATVGAFALLVGLIYAMGWTLIRLRNRFTGKVQR